MAIRPFLDGTQAVAFGVKQERYHCRSSKLLLNTNKSPETLAREVMTPKGATEQGIHLLEANNVNSIVKNALLAASKRADELSKIKGEGSESFFSSISKT